MKFCPLDKHFNWDFKGYSPGFKTITPYEKLQSLFFPLEFLEILE